MCTSSNVADMTVARSEVVPNCMVIYEHGYTKGGVNHRFKKEGICMIMMSTDLIFV